MWRDFGRWVRTRLLRAHILLLWLLVLAALVATGTDHLKPTVAAGLLAMLITAFRLWDDLADRPHDGLHHPERIAAYSRHVHALAALTGAGLAISALALWQLRDAVRAGQLVLICAGFALLYRVLPSLSPRRGLRALLVLSKYPLFILLLAPERAGGRALFVGSLLYVLLATHELRSERLQTCGMGPRTHDIRSSCDDT